MYKVSSKRSSPFTVTLPTEGWGHWKQSGAIENKSEPLPHLHANIS